MALIKVGLGRFNAPKGPGAWTFREGKTTRPPKGGMTPSRLYHRRPACFSCLGAHRDAAKPRTKKAALGSLQTSVCQHDPIAKIRIQRQPLWRSKLTPGGTPRLLL